MIALQLVFFCIVCLDAYISTFVVLSAFQNKTSPKSKSQQDSSTDVYLETPSSDFEKLFKLRYHTAMGPMYSRMV